MAGEMEQLILLIPVFNDWRAVELLMEQLDRELDQLPWRVQVLLVDDGSTQPIPAEAFARPFSKIERLNVLVLRRNLGHQRALAIGLAYVQAHVPCEAVVIMDGDGEDAPQDIPKLLARFEEHKRQRIIFAARARRAEGFVFRSFYELYKAAHLALTGIPVRVGNFSLIPQHLLSRLVVVSDLWNHYAASVFKARLPLDMVETQRAPRLAGQSKMNFTNLVIHGLSAISVFGDRVGVRMLIATSVLLGIAVVALGAVVCIRVFTHLAIPGWATYAFGILLVLTVQLLMTMMVFVFVVLGGRESSSFLPIRDHGYFVERTVTLWPTHAHPVP
jgi:glycosyltransferase involved in cell wall biosynthesis